MSVCLFVCPLLTWEQVGRLSQIFRVAPGCPRDGLRCRKVGVGSWVWVRKLTFFISHGTRKPGEWAQTYDCGSSAAGLGLRGAGTDGPTVRAAV